MAAQDSRTTVLKIATDGTSQVASGRLKKTGACAPAEAGACPMAAAVLKAFAFEKDATKRKERGAAS